MKITRIFGPDDTPHEGLWSLQWDDAEANEYERLYDDWLDTEYMYAFCEDA